MKIFKKIVYAILMANMFFAALGSSLHCLLGWTAAFILFCLIDNDNANKD